MKQLSVVVVVHAPPAVAWEVLTDLEGAPEVLSGVRNIERLSPDTGYRVGTSWRETRVMFGQEATEVMTVTAVQPERRTELRAESHGMRYETVFEVQPVAEPPRASDALATHDTWMAPGAPATPQARAARTQVVMRFRGEPVRQGWGMRLLGALTGPLGAAASRRAMRQDLRDIAAEAERRSVGPAC